MLRTYGNLINTFEGKWFTGVDVGITLEDLRILRDVTKWVIARDVSPETARGAIYGMKACAKEVWGTNSLKGLSVAVQGVGKVGYHLVKQLDREGAYVIASDIRPEALQRIAKEVEVKQVDPERIYDVECDIFAPCALGGILNDETIPRLKCKIIAGAANDQLKEKNHGDIIHKRGIIYAPDYIINAGGLIAVWAEIQNKTEHWISNELRKIEDRIRRIILCSKAENKPTHRVAHEAIVRRMLRLERAISESKLLHHYE